MHAPHPRSSARGRRPVVLLAVGAVVGAAVLGLGPASFASPLGAGRAPAATGGGSGSGSSSAGTRSYVVRPGDTVAAVSRRTGVAVADLRAANGLVGDRLYAGARLVLVPGAAAGSSRPAKGPRILCPVPGASFMNDWGFPRGSTRFHEGTDLFAPRGTTVAAPITGQLTFGANGLGGRTFTIVSPSGWVAYGAHLNSTVGGARWVAAGTPVGTVGDSGNARGGPTHLHLGLRLGWRGAPVNPYPSVAAAC